VGLGRLVWVGVHVIGFFSESFPWQKVPLPETNSLHLIVERRLSFSSSAHFHFGWFQGGQNAYTHFPSHQFRLIHLLSLHASILPFLHVIILKFKTNKPQLAGDGASQFEKAWVKLDHFARVFGWWKLGPATTSRKRVEKRCKKKVLGIPMMIWLKKNLLQANLVGVNVQISFWTPKWVGVQCAVFCLKQGPTLGHIIHVRYVFLPHPVTVGFLTFRINVSVTVNCSSDKRESNHPNWMQLQIKITKCWDEMKGW